MDNYFNYFTEIEEHFQQRRGSLLLLSTLDWALIETWREAGIPLAAALRGIDSAFDKYETRKSKRATARINSLAWCAQAVMAAAEEMAAAAAGAHRERPVEDSGFSTARVASHLLGAAYALSKAAEALGESSAAQACCLSITQQLRELAQLGENPDLESLEITLSALEEKLFAALLAATPEAVLIGWKRQATQDFAAHRMRLHAAQMQVVQRQYLQKRLTEAYGLQRLSLFYMRHG